MKTQHHTQNPNARSTLVKTHTPSTFPAGMSQIGKTSLIKRALYLGLCMAITAPSFAQSGVTFTRITSGDLVTDMTITAGAAVLDYDNDGDLDLYTANEMEKNNLYRNDGGGVFTRIAGPQNSESQGTGRRRSIPEETVQDTIIHVGSLITDFGDSESATVVDYDNDGFQDIYVANQGGRNFLYRNLGNGTFERIMDTPIATDVANATDSVWADADNDGWLDVFVLNRYSKDAFYWSDGAGGFIPADPAHPLANITNSEEYTGLWFDYDNDNDSDLYVLTRNAPDVLLENDGTGAFTRVIKDSSLAVIPFLTGGFSLSANAGDYDNDGDLDLYVGHLGINDLFINTGGGVFERAPRTLGGINEGDWITAGAMWGDYDNDGFLDLVSVNHSDQRNRLFRNNGDGTFEEIMDSPISRGYGSSQGVVWFDYDNDGFLDLYVSNGFETSTRERDYLYHNGGNENHWLKVDLQGTISNRSGVGAKIEVITQVRGKTLMQVREISTRGGWSGSGLQAHFGLGDATAVEFMLVWWPSGIVQELHDIPADQTLIVTEALPDEAPQP